MRKLTPKTSLGFALIEFSSDVLGIEMLPWQRWLAIHALELLPDGTFRFRTILLLVARQNGKSTFLQILALFFLYVRGVALVIGTAQNLDIAEEVWQGAVDIAQDVPDLAAEIDRVVMVNGKKSLILNRGERYKVQAANRRGGRGLSGDLVLLDELREHQTWDAWGAVTKTTMARLLAQIWAASNAGDGSSVVLGFLRTLAHTAVGDPDGLNDGDVEQAADDVDDESLGIFEWSAPPGCGLDDRDGWAQANPSLGHTIHERAILSARRTDPEAVFRTEVLCQWVEDPRANVVRLDRWAACEDPNSTIVTPLVFAIDVTPERSWAALAVAGFRPDGLEHVEIDGRSGPGTGWLPPLLAELRARYPSAKFIGDPTGPAGSVFTDVRSLGFELDGVSGREYAQACASFHDAVIEERMRHRPDALLNAALVGATKRDVGDGAFTWSRKSSHVNIAPLVAATLALAALGGPTATPDFKSLDDYLDEE